MNKETKESLIEYCVSAFGKSSPHITPKDYINIVQAGFDNYFDGQKMREWIDKTIPHVSPDEVILLRAQLDSFLYAETHLLCDGYTSLAERKTLEVVA